MTPLDIAVLCEQKVRKLGDRAMFYNLRKWQNHNSDLKKTINIRSLKIILLLNNKPEILHLNVNKILFEINEIFL